MHVEDTDMAKAKRKVARLKASIAALQPLAQLGDLEAQEEIITLKASLSAAAEEVTSQKSPTEQVSILKAALQRRQHSLIAAETSLAAAKRSVEDWEGQVRECKHSVEKTQVDLARAEGLAGRVGGSIPSLVLDQQSIDL